MRRAYKTLWLHLDSKLLALSLGADATTEHEIGTKPMQDNLGANASSVAGFDERVIRRLPATFGAMQLPDGSFLVSTHLGWAESELQGELRLSGFDQFTVAAWDDEHFAIRSRGDEVPYLEELEQALRNGQAMFGGCLSKKFDVRGLTLALVARVPVDVKVDVETKAASAKRLAIAADTLRLDVELRAAGCRWFALSPYWKDASESEVVFFLNPMGQDKFNSGRFSVDELRQWAKGEGPVLRSHKAALAA